MSVGAEEEQTPLICVVRLTSSPAASGACSRRPFPTFKHLAHRSALAVALLLRDDPGGICVEVLGPLYMRYHARKSDSSEWMTKVGRCICPNFSWQKPSHLEEHAPPSSRSLACTCSLLTYS
jgi:hypothetical protein